MYIYDTLIWWFNLLRFYYLYLVRKRVFFQPRNRRVEVIKYVFEIYEDQRVLYNQYNEW